MKARLRRERRHVARHGAHHPGAEETVQLCCLNVSEGYGEEGVRAQPLTAALAVCSRDAARKGQGSVTEDD